MAKRILIRRDVTANWNSVNPILSNGELGIEIKNDGTRSMKLGTGSIPWNSLGYFINDLATLTDLEMHKNNTTAHSAIDVPTANRIAMYNVSGGLKSNKVPSESNDVLRKTELDTINNDISGIIFDLDTEIDNRTSGDIYLQSEINTVEADLANEILSRISGDIYLQDEIDTVEADLETEINNRISDVSGLQFNIDTVEDNLITETDDRISGDIYLQSEIDILEADLATEINNRISDVSGLQFDIDIVDLKLNNEITDREDAISGVIYIASEDATTKANTAENNAKQYADDLALATQKWIAAVQTSADLPANPGTGTYLCRVITGSDYGVYQWIGTDTTPSWTFFSDNLDFIDRIANPVTDNIPIITSNGELIDGGESISGILNTISTGLATKENTITAGTTSQYFRGDKTWQTLNKTAVGLGNVDNTSDVNKPVSTATQTALDDKVDNATLDDYYTESEVDTLLNNKEPKKYIAANESAANTYSTANPTIMVFYPEA